MFESGDRPGRWSGTRLDQSDPLPSIGSCWCLVYRRVVSSRKVEGKCPICDWPAQIFYDTETVAKLTKDEPQELRVNCPNADCENFPRTSR